MPGPGLQGERAPDAMSKRPDSPHFADYDAFWLHYLAEHRRPGTRLLHYCGTCVGLVGLIAAGITADWRPAVAAPLVGYACAWVGHFVLEGNRPATFGHPVWSFLSDFRMLGLAVAGRLDRHLARSAARRAA
jgi:hypothetical protein